MSSLPKTSISANLDLLRAVAVLCVYVGHLLGALGVRNVGSLGRFGVVLFFVHTSVVLMQSLDRLETVAETRGRLFAAFWLRRIFRIYPLSILIVTAVVVLHLPPDPNVPYQWVGAKALVANLLLVQNLVVAPDVLGPLWSLPLEVQMYVVLPFAHVCLGGARRVHPLWLWIASVPLALVLPHVNWRLQVADFAPCFCAGIVAYDLSRSRTTDAPRLPSWIWPVGILVAVALFNPLDNVDLYHKLYRAWALSLLGAVLWVYVRESPGNRIHRVFHWIADHSYSVYLTHTLLFWFALTAMAGAPLWARTLVLAATSVAVPALLFRYVERPLMLVGAHLSRRVLRPHLQRTGAVVP